MATSALFARAAAESKFVPASNSTFAFGAFARMAFNGEVGNHTGCPHTVARFPGGMMTLPPGGSTCAEPPPESIPISACAPIRAMDLTFEASRGNCWPSFLSRTMLCSAICWATSNPRITSTTPFCGGSSITPVANIERTMRRT